MLLSFPRRVTKGITFPEGDKVEGADVVAMYVVKRLLAMPRYATPLTNFVGYPLGGGALVAFATRKVNLFEVGTNLRFVTPKQTICKGQLF